MALHLSSKLLSLHGFTHGFSLRHGGVSRAPFDSLNMARNVGDDAQRVLENRRRFAQSVGYESERLVEVSQVHGAHVLNASEAVAPEAFRQNEADGLVCGREGAPLGIRVADCAAVLIGCPVTGAVAAIHAGWRGTVQHIVERAVEMMVRELGAKRESLVAALFPHIGPSAFEVGAEVAALIAEAAGGAPNVSFQPQGADKPRANLALALMAQLRTVGVDAQRVDHVLGCTFSEPARFFSFRRDGKESGRHLAVIVPRC